MQACVAGRTIGNCDWLQLTQDLGKEKVCCVRIEHRGTERRLGPPESEPDLITFGQTWRFTTSEPPS